MNIPIRQSVEITGSEAARLDKLHREFIAKLEALPENRRNAVISATAHNVVGNVDPWTQAIAQQMQSVVEINDRITKARAEIEEIERTDLSGYRPNDPDFKARTLARKHDLEETVKADMASAVAVAQDDLRRPREDAVLHFRSDDAAASKTNAILAMRDAIRAQAEQREIAEHARRLVNGERLLAGLQPLLDTDDPAQPGG